MLYKYPGKERCRMYARRSHAGSNNIWIFLREGWARTEIMLMKMHFFDKMLAQVKNLLYLCSRI